MRLYAQLFIKQKKEKIENTIIKLKYDQIDSKEREALVSSIYAEELAVFQEQDELWVKGLNIDISMFPAAVDRTEVSKKRIPEKVDTNVIDKKNTISKKIIKRAEQRGLTSGRGPTGVCAASIYAASILCKERRTQRKIAKISQVTEVTIRNRFSELIENLNLGISLKKK